jgi:hypothetical protein
MARAKPDKSKSDTRHQRILREVKDTSDEELPPPDLGWMNITRQWGTRVEPTKKGLTMDALNVGVYGEIPDHYDDRTRMPRGSYPSKGVPPLDITIKDKHELWADNAGELYEEAIQRRWSSATDIPWETLEPLPEDVEIAMCQLCTELCHHANVEQEAIGSWLRYMSYGYHEVKLHLAREAMDAGIHFEVFRKRALANGGGSTAAASCSGSSAGTRAETWSASIWRGTSRRCRPVCMSLGLESRGDVNRVILEVRGGWSIVSLFMHLLRGTYTQTLYRYGEAFAHNPAEKAIFGLCLQDKSRHLAYGLQHLRYALAHQPDQEAVFHQLLDQGERVFARELNDPVLPEALAIIMGGDVEGMRTGMKRVNGLIRDFLVQYLANVQWTGFERRDRLPKRLAKYLD